MYLEACVYTWTDTQTIIIKGREVTNLKESKKRYMKAFEGMIWLY